MATNKPEVVATIQSKHGDPESFGKRELVASTDMQAMTYGTKLIRLSDYEALQAECEELRKDARRIDWLADPNNAIGNVQLPAEIVAQNLHSLRDAIDAAMNGERP